MKHKIKRLLSLLLSLTMLTAALPTSIWAEETGFAQATGAEAELPNEPEETAEPEENTLKAEYEEVFNQDVLSKAVKKAGNLKPVTSDQIVYVELSDPDNIVVYEQEQKRGGIADFFQSVRDFFDLGKS